MLDDIGQLWGKYGAAAEDREPARYCLRCQEQLSFFKSGPWQCWKCGHAFDPENTATFREKRVFIRWKFWFPGFCLAVTSGVLSYALLLSSQADLGWSLFFSVPISFGAVLGYATRVHVWLLAVLAVFCIAAVVTGLMMMDFAGYFCGLTLGFIFTIPTMFGVGIGLVLKLVLKTTNWDQRWYFPLAFLVAFPYFSQAIESAIPRGVEVAEVRTELSVDASAEEAWQAIMFYEDVEHEPPWLLYLALPRPERSVGNKHREGELVTCFYDRGHLSKRIRRVEENRRLNFEVVEQKLHFEKDVRLLGGSFELVPQPGGKTRVVLTTRYERKLSPHWLWRPIEEEVIHTLHRHVLEGMRRKAEAAESPPEEPYKPRSPNDDDRVADIRPNRRRGTRLSARFQGTIPKFASSEIMRLHRN